MEDDIRFKTVVTDVSTVLADVLSWTDYKQLAEEIKGLKQKIASKKRPAVDNEEAQLSRSMRKIGRASCRERVLLMV